MAREHHVPGQPNKPVEGFFNKKNAMLVLGILAFSSLFYIMGLWHSSSMVNSDTARLAFREVPACHLSIPSTPLWLDFNLHHREEEEPSRNASSSQTQDLPMFEYCDMKYSEYTPCEDSERSKMFTNDMQVMRERHCPGKKERLRCLIPAPPGYKTPFPWPKSRDFAWYVNVPHKQLTVTKAEQNWIRFQGNRFQFPGGGTSFPKGARRYIQGINNLIPLKDGSIRIALDTGCGVASWGAYLASYNILTMSFAPIDIHEAQVQFALERGVPAMVGIMGTRRLPYPARAFDMAHCSRCLIPWTEYGGLYLIEVDRVLRPGGYWILSGPPINWKKHHTGWERTVTSLKTEQEAIEDIAIRLCWQKIAEAGDIAIWKKPTNHIHCIQKRRIFKDPLFCENDNADAAWYKKMEKCITPLPEVEDIKDIAGMALEKWPKRLTAIPPRITMGTIPGITGELFNEDTKLWNRRLIYYRRFLERLTYGKYRNIMDMNAGLGGFAAALANYQVWVMNVVPEDAENNTLGIIYERGLIGTYMDWCEAFSTYPRTYDLIHANGIFSMYQDRCDMVDILLEMDRILRPEGTVIIRDSVDVLVKVKKITDRIRWQSQLAHNERGPFSAEKILFLNKTQLSDIKAQSEEIS